MKKSRKQRDKNKRNKKNKGNKTIKVKRRIVPSATPEKIRKMSNHIAYQYQLFNQNPMKSYSPTINQELVTLKSIPRKEKFYFS